MFLIMFTCHFDDYPIQLFADRASAVEFGSSLSDTLPQDIENVFGMDSSAPACIKIVEFDASGRAVNCDVIKEFD